MNIIKNLLELMNEAVRNKTWWDYYHYQNGVDDYLDIINDSNHFIQNYLKKGNKSGELVDVAKFDELDNFRLEHIISIFFLGISIYNNSASVKKELDEFINNINEHMDDPYSFKNDFCYIWFLTCFIHDFGYVYELNKDATGLLIDKSEIVNNIMKENRYLRNFPTIEHIVKRLNNVVPVELIDSWKRYFWYRYAQFNVIDHGIIGGHLFYIDRSCLYNKNRIRLKYPKTINGYTDESRLYWSKDIVKYFFAPVSATIIAHNIWFANPNDSDEKLDNYRKFGLEKLIIPDPIISLNRFPLLFLLQLVDTIDFFKYSREHDISFDEMVTSISINIKSTEIDIDFKDSRFNALIKNIINMKNWLNIEININKSLVTIKFL